MKKVAFVLLVTAVVTYAQTPASPKSKSDAEKIASAQQAGPQFRKTQPCSTIQQAGTNEWTCLPGFPGAAHDEPGCFDQIFLQFIKDTTAGRAPRVQSVGIS